MRARRTGLLLYCLGIPYLSLAALMWEWRLRNPSSDERCPLSMRSSLLNNREEGAGNLHRHFFLRERRRHIFTRLPQLEEFEKNMWGC
jgi:hypothetical protein